MQETNMIKIAKDQGSEFIRDLCEMINIHVVIYSDYYCWFEILLENLL